MNSILVTGGAGYIGSHTVLTLLESGYDVIVIDNYSNSSVQSLTRIKQILGLSANQKQLTIIECDIRSKESLEKVFSENQFDSIIHFAGLKAVGESVYKPVSYYENNVLGAINIIKLMEINNIRNFVFSSSATVYGPEAPYPYLESQNRGTALHPYGASKSIIERMLEDFALAKKDISVISLRYFNPIGAHPSGMIGEDPKGVPNNLMPFISQVAIGKREALPVFGGDYPTPDGTCRRDYLHVCDLALGHVKALEYSKMNQGFDAINLGVGKPFSVFEMINAFEKSTGVTIPYEIKPRRDGDLPEFWADVSKAEELLDWKANDDLDAMMVDTWKWQSKNPDGYM